MTESTDEKIDKAIDFLTKQVEGVIDKDFVDNELENTLTRFKEKKASGERLTIEDLRDLMKIARNVLVPAAMKQQVDKLHTIKHLIKAHSKNG